MNCRSLKNKTSEFQSLVSITQPDIIIGTESWLDGDVLNNEVFPSGYTSYRKDRNTRGGGVFILVRDTVQSIPVRGDDSSESVWCRVIFPDGRNIVVGSFYRPPGCVSTAPLLSLSKSLSALSSDIVLLGGDFNMPDVTWNDTLPVENSRGAIHAAFFEIIRAYGLFQSVNFPTRITASGSSVLDLVFSNQNDFVQSVIPLPGISDHEVVSGTLMCKRVKNGRPCPRKIYLYDKGNYDSLSAELSSFLPSFVDYNQYLDIESLWTIFKEKIISLTNKFVPSKRQKQRVDKPWMTKELRTSIKRKARMYKTFRRTKSPSLYAKLKEFSMQLKHDLKLSKHRYLSSLADRMKKNPKEVWRYIKNNKKDPVGIPAITDNGKLLEDNFTKAECFNAYFYSMFSAQNPTFMSHSLPQLPDMNEIVITEQGVTSLLSNLNPYSAYGPDGISNHILKRCAAALAPFLVLIFNVSLQTEMLPRDWKSANVTPMHKAGDRNQVCNYRPVSLTSVCCKTLEHILYSSIIKHLEGNHFFSPAQHGFRSGLSCVTQLTEFIHDVAFTFDQGLQVDAVFLDFKKAFDVVPHNLLLHKLSLLGIPSRLLGWLKQYLIAREQRVVIGGTSSSPVEVLSGVPQGSVLGPLLFLVFVNDLPNGIRSNIRLYADDCVLYCPVKSVGDSRVLQADLFRVSDWCVQWKMNLNIAKCYHVTFTNKKKPLQCSYLLNNNVLQNVQQIKYLGVTLNSKLDWIDHIHATAAKASRLLYFFQRNFKHSPQSLKETLYFTNIRPILEYACAVWDPHTEVLKQQLERVQKRAARFVTGNFNFDIRSSVIRDNLGWQTLCSRRKICRLKLLYNIKIGSTGINKNTYLKTPNYVSARRDNTEKIKPYQCRINVFKYSFFPNTINDWNVLPNEIVRSPNVLTAIESVS